MVDSANTHQPIKSIVGAPGTPAFCIAVFKSSLAAMRAPLAGSKTLVTITMSLGSSRCGIYGRQWSSPDSARFCAS